MAMEGGGAVEERFNLLVVDDADGVRDVLAIQLGRMGYAVSLAENASQALDLINAGNFDLILLDIRLPGMSGLELLKQLRQSLTPLDTPIIVISGLDQTNDVVTALGSGANDYVTKPFDLAVVLARIRTQLTLKRLKQVTDRFLKVASHDLKKPLLLMLDAARQVKTEHAAGTPMTPDGQETLALIIESGEYMRRIIEDLLELRAIRDGHLRLVKLPTDIGAVVRQAVTRNMTQAKAKGIELRMQFETGLPPIPADDFRVLQVLENLIGNAIKFSPAGRPITVFTRREPGYLMCEVTDAGPGIPENEMGRLFLEYATLSNRPTGGEQSTGLGLSICKELILLHGGEIGVHNNPGGGATFWFRLPLN
jgi:signal transduction histidine kinase